MIADFSIGYWETKPKLKKKTSFHFKPSLKFTQTQSSKMFAVNEVDKKRMEI